MSVRVNANLRSETVEQLLEKKKGMHMTSARLLADEVKAELERLAVSVETLERKKRDIFVQALGDDPMNAFSAKINAQCDAILERHESMGAADYANDNKFRSIVSEILNMKSWAIEKWQLWLKDESKNIEQVCSASLAECHRMWLSLLRKRIRKAAAGSDERRRACLELLQSKGLVEAAAHGELNAEEEDVVVAAGAEGWSAEDINALLAAGADITTADVNGKTGVWNAASCGHLLTLKALLGAGGDVNTRCNDSERNTEMCLTAASALFMAAFNGHDDCVEELIVSGADVLACTS